ncbi:MAG: hypothetical protein RLN62_06485 [Rickettsiales bacterium]
MKKLVFVLLVSLVAGEVFAAAPPPPAPTAPTTPSPQGNLYGSQQQQTPAMYNQQQQQPQYNQQNNPYKPPSVSQGAQQQTLKALQNVQNNQQKKAPTPNHPVAQRQNTAQYKNATLQKNESLQQVINNLSDQDRKVVLGIQREISTWPQTIIAELSLYRDYILTVRKEAEKKYNKLSPQAKRALLIEEDMKKKLSKQALEALESAKVDPKSVDFAKR